MSKFIARTLTILQLFGFLRSEQAKAAPYERTAQESRDAMKSIEDTIKGIWVIHAQQVQQTKTLSVFALLITALLFLTFCTLVCSPRPRWVYSDKKLYQYFGMDNIKGFSGNPLSRRDFWLTTGPVCLGVIVLSVILISWERPRWARFRA